MIKPRKDELKAYDSDIAEEILNLDEISSQVIVNKLEENIQLRETPIEKRFSKKKIETIK